MEKTKTKEPKIKKITINTKEDLNKLTKLELIDFSTHLLETISSNNVFNKLDIDNALLAYEKSKLELFVGKHSIEKQKLFTILDMMNNIKSLLTTFKTGEYTNSENYNLDEPVKTVANDTILDCLVQIKTWLKNNNINNLKLNKDEKDRIDTCDDAINIDSKKSK